MQPSQRSLKALLACCAELESRPGKSSLGAAAGPGCSLPGVGYVDLGQVLAACREALDVQQQQQLAPAAGAAAAAAGTGASDSSSDGARRLAADLLRTWAFSATFEYVNGVRAHGPTWALSAGGSAAIHAAAVAPVSGSRSEGSDDDAACSAV
jgi:hypothetical protein